MRRQSVGVIGSRLQLLCGIALVLAAACTGGSATDSSTDSAALSIEVNGVAYVLPAGEQYALWIDLDLPMMAIRDCGTELDKVLAAPDPPPRYLLLQVRRCARKLDVAIEFIGDGSDSAHEAVSAVVRALGDVCGRVGDLADGVSLPTDLRTEVSEATAAVAALTRWYDGLRDGSMTTQPA